MPEKKIRTSARQDRLNRCKNQMTVRVRPDRNRQPPKCYLCPFYQPEFRYRRCLFSICPYGKGSGAVFRKKPLKKELVTRWKGGIRDA